MFDDVLREIVHRAGAVGAVLMGYDGIAIDQYFTPVEGVDLQLMAVEYAGILKEIRKAAEILNTGDMEEVTIRTAKYVVVIRTLTDDYFVALTLEKDGNAGKGRFLLLRDAPALKAALA